MSCIVSWIMSCIMSCRAHSVMHYAKHCVMRCVMPRLLIAEPNVTMHAGLFWLRQQACVSPVSL
jgi:hypothetical protein